MKSTIASGAYPRSLETQKLPSTSLLRTTFLIPRESSPISRDTVITDDPMFYDDPVPRPKPSEVTIYLHQESVKYTRLRLLSPALMLLA